LRAGWVVLLGSLLAPSLSSPASADLNADSNNKSVKVWAQQAKRTKAYKSYQYQIHLRGPEGTKPPRDPGLSYSDVSRQVQAQVDASSPCQYFNQRNMFCTYQLTDTPANNPKPPKPGKKAPKNKPVYVVTLTSEQAAQLAVARLKLPMVRPGIGPDPSINRWKMAAVGYPLWLWADGPAHLGPVGQSVGNLRVGLDARLTSVTYEMGDGRTVTCSGPGRPWTRAVPADAESSCGYRYAAPSLPKGDYTVRAVSHWDIAWTVQGQSGVIEMDQVGTRHLPVGELQVLIR
jgi:hypothetical protein